MQKIKAVVFQGGGYQSELGVSSDGLRAAGVLSRGSITNLFCFGVCGACCCPYNRWFLRIWFEGDALRWEISRESNMCVHLCFGGWIGLMLLNQNYSDIKSMVSKCLRQVRAGGGMVGGGVGGVEGVAAPLYAPPPPYSAPESMPMHKSGFPPAAPMAEPFALTVPVNNYNVAEVLMATAWVVDDSHAGDNYSAIPQCQFVDVDSWLQNGKN
ncbi:hypothetical protein TL16_g09362 [Triparma laevis f. inornata]|uniref:Uncharacterized protein n=2 Tax=Triparma laevis TaxID=1534972 RepID=A0A9W7DYM9_9STRA|nr:hypothetical protein TrLO_g2196 [Triparma laevis f. longispina]GMH82736.1 hypothetical protein TL16_g09362 [Triparma laevis f. inornata]